MKSKSGHALRIIYIGVTAIIVAAIVLTSCQTQPDTTSPATTTPATTTPTGPHLVTFNSDDFAGSGNCAACHSSLADAGGNDVSIDSHWRSTMMANAARDPLWQAKVASEVARTPALQELIEGTCALCHMPMAYTQAEASGQPTLMLGSGFLNPANALHEAAMDGNSCSLCHQIQPDNLGQADSFKGNYQIDTSTEPPNRPEFGPFPEPLVGPMQQSVGFTPTQGAHIDDAELCATCHTVLTPTVDEDGNVLGTFPEQTPYLEWKHSLYGFGMACQSCHMPAASGAVAISNTPSGLSGRSPFSQHHFIGGNSFMIQLLKDNVQELSLTASASHFEATLALLSEQLQSRSASLSLAKTTLDGNNLEIAVNISGKTGHKFPTGFPSRRAWIHLTVTDAGGRVVFESGKPNPDGSITGNDADESPSTYEQHYDTINRSDQVQIYEPIMLDSNGQVTYTLLSAASYAKDNRILPAGFDKASASPEIAVYGSAADDDNFIGGSDQITYLVDTQGFSGPFTITVELLYQSVSYQFALDLFTDSHSLITLFDSLYQQADKLPTLLVSIERSVS